MKIRGGDLKSFRIYISEFHMRPSYYLVIGFLTIDFLRKIFSAPAGSRLILIFQYYDAISYGLSRDSKIPEIFQNLSKD